MSWMDDLDEDTSQKIKTVALGGIGIVVVLATVYFIFAYLVATETNGDKRPQRGGEQRRGGYYDDFPER
jgi:hypothetical protein